MIVSKESVDPAFLSVDEVLEIHEQQIERYGGSAGLRDIAGLESAVATPQATFGGIFLHGTIPAMAAAYLFHLCQNHPFIDGNKRVGVNAAITFFLINNWRPTFNADELVELGFRALPDASSALVRLFGRPRNSNCSLTRFGATIDRQSILISSRVCGDYTKRMAIVEILTAARTLTVEVNRPLLTPIT